MKILNLTIWKNCLKEILFHYASSNKTNNVMEKKMVAHFMKMVDLCDYDGIFIL